MQTSEKKIYPDNLATLARRIAQEQILFPGKPRKTNWLTRLDKLSSFISQVYDRYSENARQSEVLSKTAEWLLDNDYIIQQALLQVKQDMPPAFYQRLPKLEAAAGQPAETARIYDLARRLIIYKQASLDMRELTEFIQIYQETQTLQMGEIWAFPAMLRLGVLEYLTQVLVERDQHEFDNPPQGTPLAALQQDVASGVLTGNCIRALRTLSAYDWNDFFEEVSLVEAVLGQDPAGAYAQSSFETRDRYRKVIETLAEGETRSELEVSQSAVNLAAQHPDDPRRAHVGYYLVAEGRPELENQLGYKPSFEQQLRRWADRHAVGLYLSAILGLTLILTALFVSALLLPTQAPLWQTLIFSALALIPASMLAVSLVNLSIPHLVPTRLLPEMDFHEGIPAEMRTMVVVPALLSRPGEIDFLMRQLERHFLGNPDPHLSYALLTDFADADQESMPEDKSLLILAEAGIDALNRQYGSSQAGQPFYIFHRPRKWNPAEATWMGWERKRGKLEEFNHLLAEASEGKPLTDSPYLLQVGDLSVLAKIRFVITLDADTILPLETAHQLVGALAHPLNRARIDPATKRVTAGYTILQPRIDIRPASANASWFSRIFSDNHGIDLYSHAVSDTYQDLFGEGIFVGKGIYDPHAFRAILGGCIPENSLLSHDLFEGLLSRAGLLSTVVLYEDYPERYLPYAQRMHRWVRGDWQLLPWLLPRRAKKTLRSNCGQFSTIDTWKIVDNLRRSLEAPSLVALLVAIWLLLPGQHLFWSILILASPTLLLLVHAALESLEAIRQPQQRELHHASRNKFLQSLLSSVFLLHTAWVALDAIVTTLIRLFITHKRLLQWTTYAHTARLFRRERRLTVVWNYMMPTSWIVLTLGALVLWLNPPAFAWISPILLMWLLSPLVAEQIGRPLRAEVEALTADQTLELRKLARQTWLFFERFVGPDDHWLPPDHFQESPRGLAAHRTSPTNIGLLLTSTLCAYELGYIGVLNLKTRLQSAFESLDQLERYRGHFLNWYETNQLQPLTPRYVSTVDSGNLAASMWTLRQALRAMPGQPTISAQRWQGLGDSLQMLLEAIDGTKLTTDKPAPQVQALIKTLRAQIKVFHQQTLQAPEKSSNWREQVTAFQDHEWAAIHQSMADLVETGALSVPSLPGILRWVERIDEHLLNLQLQIDALLPWWRLLAQPPALLQNESGNPALAAAWQDLEPILITIPPLARLAETAQAGLEKLTALQEILSQSASTEADWLTANAWAAQLQSSLETGLDEGPRLLQELQTLETTLENTVQAMDFTFLYNPKQKVFHLGYDLASDQLDSNHYDLLASEARTASLIAIAKGDVPAEHWLHLNRPIVALDHTRTLLSWNGSMFEYLMPDLMIRTYPGSLQYQTNRAVVRRQIEYAGQQGAPWGISEAGYYNFDNQQNYQYRGFGVPGLGRKRNLAKDLVIAPYASLLALHINPQAVMENLEHLQAEQALGPFGYYESIDYTPARLPLNQKRAIVRSYMAHHQGMILNSVCNALCDDVLVRYFHLDPRAESVELLLQERFPPQAPVEQTPREFEQTALERAGSARPSSLRAPLALKAWPIPQNPPWPQAQYLSNGSYSVLITESGGGFSRYRDERGESEQNVALTRWRADATLDDWGSWLYVQDEERDQTFSVGAQPLPGESKPGQYQVKFSPHKAEFQRREGDLSISLEVGVAPNDPLEIRRVTVRNQSAQTRRLSLTSYGEVVLSSQAADQQHPAFNKLFVESQYLPEEGLLLFSRRARSPGEMPLVLAHCVVLPNSQAGDSSYETDRAKFLGRGQNARSAAALQKALSHTPQEAAAGPSASLDPIFAIRQEVEVRPYQSVQLAYLTLCAPSVEEAIAIARRYRTLAAIEQAFRQTQRQQEAELAEAGLSAAQLQHYQQLLSALVYPNPALRAAPERLAANQQGQPSLWRFGISGDEAILLVKINDLAEIGLVHESLAAHRFWRRRQFPFDLVILNQKDRGYAQDLHEQIQRLVTQLESDHWLNRRGGIFLLRASDLPEQTPLLLESAARIVLDGQRGPLGEQLQPLLHAPTYLPRIMASRARAEASSLRAVPRPANLQFDNGLGGFSPDGKEYQIYLEEGQWTPMAWSNVIANPNFGLLTSEAGFGFTWAGNSGENRLTPWHNDPLQDRPGEALYLRDEETLRVWSPTPLPARSPEPYLIRHGAGYSIYQHHSQGLIQSVKVFAAPDAPLKMVVLQLENPGKRGRRITATYYVEWVLDAQRATAQQFILPEYEPASGALLAANPYNPQFQKNVAFLAGSQNPHGLTTDRREFLGRLGDLSHPAALTRVGLSSKVEAGLDPCAALQLHIDLAAGETKQVFFLLGQGRDKADALDLIQQYRSEERVAAVWQASQSSWEDLLGQVQVKTPEPALDILLNHWLLYQNLSCRIWGRSAAYQSSGAYGFRDQLQDVLALIDTQPSLVREQILRAARHQFEAGDVLHWWHPPFGRGVRTRVSDDLLWLPYVTAAYLRITHDFEILNESLPFLVGAPLSPTEHERYDLYASTPESFSLYEHCRRAIARGSTQGAHGLPLIGGGDWNDGMNRVGIEGYGESVWLGWFLYTVLEDFAPLSERIGDAEQAESYRQRAKQLQENLHSHAWDGAWYRRAYFDDGSPLGSTQNSECQIDSIAQSWAVISGAGESERNVQAMQAVYERLVEQEARLLLLFRPPFDETEHDPGYIKGYPAGIRENGGQYTHGALWTVWAVAQMGNGERAAELYRLLNPILHADTPEKAARYAVEPYVIAADVYSAPGLVGRGGWTWYTGSAGWAYRVGLEMMLGLRRQAQQLTINPCIPPTWKSFHIDYRYQKSVYQIQVENPQAVAQGIASVALDGQICPDGIIPLRDDGQEHHVLVTMGTQTD